MNDIGLLPGNLLKRLFQFGIEAGLSNGTNIINTAKLYCKYAIFLRSLILLRK